MLSPVTTADPLEELARADLAAALARGDATRQAVLEALLESGGTLAHYEPERRRYTVVLGDPATDDHVAVLVPGVGDDRDLSEHWLVWARTLRESASSTTVILWKDYDDPADLREAVLAEIVRDDRARSGGRSLTDFVESLTLRAGQTLTVVAHSFGTIVLGSALADHELRCTNVVVVGSPGMTVDDVRDLHLTQRQFFVERAPEDAVAGLGLLGSDPASEGFGGTWLSTNSPGSVPVREHSHYFEPGSEALANIVDVITGQLAGIRRHRRSLGDRLGGLVTGSMILPLRPVEEVSRRYRGPGFRLILFAESAIHLGANETGNLVRNAVDFTEHTLVALARRPPIPGLGD
jgi:pimeloyl-ACP methyl ester carboxylesterase